MLRNTIKNALLRIAPGPAKYVASVLRRASPSLWEQISPDVTARTLDKITKRIVSEQGAVVGSGPFRGMRYIDQATGSMLVPKLLGSYEAELHPWIEEIIVTPYQTAIDIGCAEGYYAVGLAKHLGSEVKVYAYDIDPAAQALCQKLSLLNNVQDKVTVKGLCDWNEIEEKSVGKTLILCDCEGAELDLLNPEKAPSLRHSDILVELHDFTDRRITPQITERFRETHEARMIFSCDKVAMDYPFLNNFPSQQQYLALSEFRPEIMQWAFFKAKKPGE